MSSISWFLGFLGSYSAPTRATNSSGIERAGQRSALPQIPPSDGRVGGRDLNGGLAGFPHHPRPQGKSIMSASIILPYRTVPLMRMHSIIQPRPNETLVILHSYIALPSVSSNPAHAAQTARIH